VNPRNRSSPLLTLLSIREAEDWDLKMVKLANTYANEDASINYDDLLSSKLLKFWQIYLNILKLSYEK
jgi:hypothetical protein